MKALLALNESTTAEIIADLLQIPPEQAQAMAGQMRLSEILSLVQELKANNMWEASEIVKPDGRAWIHDDTKYHTVTNGGETPRVSLVTTLLN